MSRGLLIRQLFLGLDVLLALGFILLAYSTVSAAFSGIAPSEVEAVSTLPVKPNTIHRSVVSLKTFQDIISRPLFGDAASLAGPDKPKAEEQVAQAEVPTQLALDLYGTASAGPNDPRGIAVIKDRGTQQTGVYHLGETVVANVILKEIRHREVVLLNKNTHQLEVLRIASARAAGNTSSAPPPPRRRNRVMPHRRRADSRAHGTPSRPAVSRSGPNQPVRVNVKALYEKLPKSYTELYALVSPELATDSSGNVIGLTSKNIDKIPVARELGFQGGDIIQKINGVPIDSERAVLETMQKFQNARTFYITVLRNGSPQTLTFQVE